MLRMRKPAPCVSCHRLGPMFASLMFATTPALACGDNHGRDDHGADPDVASVSDSGVLDDDFGRDDPWTEPAEECHWDCFAETVCAGGFVWETPQGGAPCDVSDPCGPEYWESLWGCDEGCGQALCVEDEAVFELVGDDVAVAWATAPLPSVRQPSGDLLQVATPGGDDTGTDPAPVIRVAAMFGSEPVAPDPIPGAAVQYALAPSEGQARVEIDDAEYVLEAGVLVAITPGTWLSPAGPSTPEHGLVRGTTADGTEVVVVWREGDPWDGPEPFLGARVMALAP